MVEQPQANFAVTGEATRRADHRTLKSDDSFLICNGSGDIISNADGLYHRDTRHLSKFMITLDERSQLLSSSIDAENAMLTSYLATPAQQKNTDMGDDGNEILLKRETFLWLNARCDRLSLVNWSRLPQHVTLSVSFAADFADLFEIRGAKRARHGVIKPSLLTQTMVEFACEGLDLVSRKTSMQFAPPPDRLDYEAAVFALHLNAGETREIMVSVRCDSDAAITECAEKAGEMLAFAEAKHAADARQRSFRRAAATVITDNTMVNAALQRARDDLVMLTTDTGQGLYPYAGVPWFSTAFGRDGLITALQVLWLAPDLARGVLTYLAANQATEFDAASDAEPGKILHEARDGEMARCGEVPFRRYYGSVDSTPLFVMLAGAYLKRTGDLDFMRALWPNLTAALEWIDRYGDADGDGFVEYGRKSTNGLQNQGWKDSQDAIFHADGRLAKGAIALCEVQAYVFAARIAASEIAAALGKAKEASQLSAQAASLREAFDAAFWDGELGFYVLALDGEKHPCRVLASNAGHALFAGIALPERAGIIADKLMGPDFFSGWGIRTVAQGQPRYNPMSYHNGSVWPHDNALIGLGLARYGRGQDAARVFEALFAGARAQERFRLPELFCGLPRQPGTAPVAYPVACAPQAWASAALPALLDACIGLEFDPAGKSVQAAAPVLPAGLRRLRLDNLMVGGQGIRLALARGPAGRVTVEA